MSTPRYIKKTKTCVCRICGEKFLASRADAKLCPDEHCQYIYHKGYHHKYKNKEKES